MDVDARDNAGRGDIGEEVSPRPNTSGATHLNLYDDAETKQVPVCHAPSDSPLFRAMPTPIQRGRETRAFQRALVII
jgi:hypothetical protein